MIRIDIRKLALSFPWLVLEDDVDLEWHHKWREETPPEQQGTISIECQTTTHDHSYNNLAHAG